MEVLKIARPRKFRNVCELPETNRFGPLGMGAHGRGNANRFIIMSIDEYETIRLIDLEGLTQEECAQQMNIARTTVQRTYSDARKKIAQSLVKGKVLKIEGGDYKLCDGNGRFCGIGNCHRGGNKMDSENMEKIEESQKERKTMKIVMPVDENNMETKVSVSFGRAPFFLVYDLETKENTFIDNKAATSPGGAGIIAAQTVVDSKTEALLTPRCGQNAADVLKSGKVKLYKSIDGTVEENIKAFNDGKLDPLDEIHAGFHKHGE